MNVKELKAEFIRKFGAGEGAVYFSPGRVNLIGEHTDYNGGYVFPCALSYGTYLLVRLNNTETIRFASVNFSFEATVGISEISKKHGKEWVNYPLGVMNEFVRRDIVLKGMDMLYYGNIPNGAGLSSSASVELVTGVALNDIFKAGISQIDLALIGQKAENSFVGVNCGIMDQFAVAMGQKDRAIFLNCDSLDYEMVPAEFANYKLVIANTNKQRGLADSKYNERRSECDKAVEYISQKKPVKLLAEVSPDELLQLDSLISEPVVKRRARHVVTEIDRVIKAVSSLKAGDLKAFGQLMNQSHDSLRDDYEVTGNELDTLVDEARKIDGVIGSRMTGAGFGGCTVSLVDEKSVDRFVSEVGKSYQARTGLKADFYVAEVGEGARLLEKF